MASRPRIAITMGDPAGVGPELCVRLLSQHDVIRQCIPIVIGDATILQRVAHQLGLPPSLSGCQILSTSDLNQLLKPISEPTIVDLHAIADHDVQPGIVSEATGRASYAYIVASIDAALAGQVDARNDRADS